MWRIVFIAVVLYLGYSVLKSCEAPTQYEVNQEIQNVQDKAANSEVGRTVKDAVRDVEKLTE